MTQSTDSGPGKLLPRFIARVIDGIVVGVLVFLLGLGMGSYGFDWLIAGAGGVYGYFVLFDALVGSTPGKMLLGMRVVGPSGGTPSIVQAALRETFVLVGSIPFIGPLLVLIVWIWFAVTIKNSPTGQGPHDMLAGGTRVVRGA